MRLALGALVAAALLCVCTATELAVAEVPRPAMVMNCVFFHGFGQFGPRTPSADRITDPAYARSDFPEYWYVLCALLCSVVGLCCFVLLLGFVVCRAVHARLTPCVRHCLWSMLDRGTLKQRLRHACNGRTVFYWTDTNSRSWRDAGLQKEFCDVIRTYKADVVYTHR